MKQEDSKRFTCIIPARYASTRFPGKPLAIIAGKTMIRRVWEQVSLAVGSVFVATDDERIAGEVKSFGGRYIMTSPGHRSGTDRCEEAVSIIEQKGNLTEIVINVQGDEPFIRKEHLLLLMACFEDPGVNIATLIRKFSEDEDISNPNYPKVITNIRGNAIYFSRAVIPYLREPAAGDRPIQHTWFRHLGMYAFRRNILREITSLPQSSLELTEALEQNRWIENGYTIRTAISPWDSLGIDTPEDLEKANSFSDKYF